MVRQKSIKREDQERHMWVGEAIVETGRDRSDQLRSYVLPDDVLPLAPRQPFHRFSQSALDSAIGLSLARPEKRGMISHAVRDIYGIGDCPPLTHSVTIEAHFDSVVISNELADQLLELGFELDGFAEFLPAHFREHFTLKYKIAIDDIALRQRLRREVHERCKLLVQLLTRSWPDVECYVEMETYSDRTRRSWTHSALKPGWYERIPFDAGAFRTVVPPMTEEDAALAEQPIGMVKRADIHAKISHQSCTKDREKLLESLKRIGFYPVTTWAGNDICTGQFLSPRDGRLAFRSFCDFFAENGGCSEITLETVTDMWRSSQVVGDGVQFCALPPVVVEVLDSTDLRPIRSSSSGAALAMNHGYACAMMQEGIT